MPVRFHGPTIPERSPGDLWETLYGADLPFPSGREGDFAAVIRELTNDKAALCLADGPSAVIRLLDARVRVAFSDVFTAHRQKLEVALASADEEMLHL